MRRGALAFVLLVFSGFGSSAAEPLSFTRIPRVGCGIFLQYPENTETQNLFVFWVGGFLSGLNWVSWQAGSAEGRFSNLINAMGWITDYCRRNPERPFGMAASEYAVAVLQPPPSPKDTLTLQPLPKDPQ